MPQGAFLEKYRFVFLKITTRASVLERRSLSREPHDRAVKEVRIIRLTRELDRYHGFAPAPVPRCRSRLGDSPRRRGQPRLTNSRAEEDAKFSTSHPLEIAENRETISETETSDARPAPVADAERGWHQFLALVVRGRAG